MLIEEAAGLFLLGARGVVHAQVREEGEEEHGESGADQAEPAFESRAARLDNERGEAGDRNQRGQHVAHGEEHALGTHVAALGNGGR
jgi:hypothetical protein